MQIRRGWYAVAPVLWAAASTAGCSSKPPPPPPQAVLVLRLQPETVHLERTYVGRIEALQSAEIRPRATGYVTGYFFEEGDRVERGQLLFRLDTRPYRIRTAAAAAKVARADAEAAKTRALTDQARDRVRRYLPLANTRAIPQEQYIDAVAAVKVQEASLDQAQAEGRIARTELAEARLEESFAEVRAPINGIAGARQASVGDLVSADDARLLVTISESTRVRVRVAISDADYLRYVGTDGASTDADGRDLEWRLILADGSPYPLTGRQVAISRAADPHTGTMELVLQFDNPKSRLRPGQYAQVAANVVHLRSALLIPVTCVRISQGSKTVDILGPDDVVAQRGIVADDRAGDYYVVTQGLAAGDTVIVGGEQKVKVGDHVKPQVAATHPEDPKAP